VLSELII